MSDQRTPEQDFRAQAVGQAAASIAQLERALNLQADPAAPLCYDRATRSKVRSLLAELAHLVHSGGIVASDTEYRPSDQDTGFRKLLGDIQSHGPLPTAGDSEA